MRDGRSSGTWRRWLGTGLVVGLVLAAGGLLEASAEQPHGDLFVRMFLVAGLFAVAAYVFAVHLPQRRAERRRVLHTPAADSGDGEGDCPPN